MTNFSFDVKNTLPVNPASAGKLRRMNFKNVEKIADFTDNAIHFGHSVVKFEDHISGAALSDLRMLDIREVLRVKDNMKYEFRRETSVDVYNRNFCKLLSNLTVRTDVSTVLLDYNFYIDLGTLFDPIARKGAKGWKISDTKIYEFLLQSKHTMGLSDEAKKLLFNILCIRLNKLEKLYVTVSTSNLENKFMDLSFENFQNSVIYKEAEVVSKMITTNPVSHDLGEEGLSWVTAEKLVYILATDGLQVATAMQYVSTSEHEIEVVLSLIKYKHSQSYDKFQQELRTKNLSIDLSLLNELCMVYDLVKWSFSDKVIAGISADSYTINTYLKKVQSMLKDNLYFELVSLSTFCDAYTIERDGASVFIRMNVNNSWEDKMFMRMQGTNKTSLLFDESASQFFFSESAFSFNSINTLYNTQNESLLSTLKLDLMKFRFLQFEGISIDALEKLALREGKINYYNSGTKFEFVYSCIFDKRKFFIDKPEVYHTDYIGAIAIGTDSKKGKDTIQLSIDWSKWLYCFNTVGSNINDNLQKFDNQLISCSFDDDPLGSVDMTFDASRKFSSNASVERFKLRGPEIWFNMVIKKNFRLKNHITALLTNVVKTPLDYYGMTDTKFVVELHKSTSLVNRLDTSHMYVAFFDEICARSSYVKERFLSTALNTSKYFSKLTAAEFNALERINVGISLCTLGVSLIWSDIIDNKLMTDMLVDVMPYMEFYATIIFKKEKSTISDKITVV